MGRIHWISPIQITTRRARRRRRCTRCPSRPPDRPAGTPSGSQASEPQRIASRSRSFSAAGRGRGSCPSRRRGREPDQPDLPRRQAPAPLRCRTGHRRTTRRPCSAPKRPPPCDILAKRSESPPLEDSRVTVSPRQPGARAGRPPGSRPASSANMQNSRYLFEEVGDLVRLVTAVPQTLGK